MLIKSERVVIAAGATVAVTLPKTNQFLKNMSFWLDSNDVAIANTDWAVTRRATAVANGTLAAATMTAVLTITTILPPSVGAGNGAGRELAYTPYDVTVTFVNHDAVDVVLVLTVVAEPLPLAL